MIDQDTLLEVMAIGEQRRAARRTFLRQMGGVAAVAGATSLLAACNDGDQPAPVPTPSPSPTATTAATDVAVLNFALNLEYLEANYYSFGAFGNGLSATNTSGVGTQGAVTGGRAVNFTDTSVAAYMREIASDENAHVAFLRSQLGSSAVAQPAINIDGTSASGAFSKAAVAAKIPSALATGTFDPYANDDNFLLGAMLLTDVGVTAYKGSATLITSKVILEAAAGILAVEAYHSGLLRTLLYRRSVQSPAPTAVASMDRQNQALISAARDTLDGNTSQTASTATPVQLYANDDQSVGPVTFTPPTAANGNVRSNIVPADANAIVFGRKAANVLNIAYLNPAAATSGGFFPNGVNGSINASAANS